MLKTVFLIVSALAIAGAQVPSLGWCPEYVPMANFDMSRFLGVWYEAERYFQLSEVVSRCVMANYTEGPDGKLRVSNEVTNRFTGIKRILEGEIKKAASRSEEGKLNVKYTTFPLTPETNYAVLESDYKNYAVLWSCQGIGPIHAQNAWIMTRSRRPAGEVMQMAYGVLDKYKISKTFFVKTDQADCAYLDTVAETDKPDYSDQQQITIEEAHATNNLRSAIIPDAADVIIQTRKTANADKLKVVKPTEELQETKPEELSRTGPIEKQTIEYVKMEEQEKSIVPVAPVVTVPEAIFKAADTDKEIKTIPKLDPHKPIIPPAELYPEAEKQLNATTSKAADTDKEEKKVPDFIPSSAIIPQFPTEFIEQPKEKVPDFIPSSAIIPQIPAAYVEQPTDFEEHSKATKTQ